ncbi:UNVERIFIED_CONTAM: hypothetical protein HHA_310370 [Hammondia hammondi]|eukprot:XP_008886566.1 hypothetical protein HHA_310370 [Hammondia hammondi]
MPVAGEAVEVPVPAGGFSASLGSAPPALSPLFSSPSELLYTFFPLVVLFVCFHAISSNSPSSPSLSISASIRAFRLHLAAVHHSLPPSLFSLNVLVSPAFLCLLLPYASFLLLRLLPALSLEPSIPPSAVAVTYSDLFQSPSVFSLPAAEASHLADERRKRVFLSFFSLPDPHTFSPLLRFLLHPFYLSQSSVVFWLVVGPFLLYSCAVYIQQAIEEERRGLTIAQQTDGQTSSPRLRAALAILICLYMPAVFMTWLVAHVFPTAEAPPFRYFGVGGAIYALAAVVFFYDPVIHSGMFADPSIQFPLPLHVRSVTSVLVFFLFLFSPPPGDLLLLLSGALSAVLAVAAASVPPFFGVSGAVAAFSAVTSAVAFGDHLGISHTLVSSVSSLFFVDFDPLESGGVSSAGKEHVRVSPDGKALPDALTWTVAGLSLVFAGGMALAGACWRWAPLLDWLVHAVRDGRSVRARLTSAAVMVAFTCLPFSFSSLPSLGELFSDPLKTLRSLPVSDPSLYAVTCTERTVLLGSIGAKTAAFWTPLFGMGSRSRKLKYFIGPLLLFLLFVGMTSEHWRRIGPGFLGTVFSLYQLLALQPQEEP